jgi:threonine dehydratase
MAITLADVEAARRTIAGRVLRTPMLPAPKLSALTGATVSVKYENLQVTNSFKERGALNKLASLTAAERARLSPRKSKPQQTRAQSCVQVSRASYLP